MNKILFSLISIVALSVSALSAQATKTYCNNRFGFCVTYPAELKVSDELPANSDGVTLEAPNGIQTSVSGSYNVMNWTPEEILEYTREDLEAVIGSSANALESETTGSGFEALLASGTYYQYVQMQSKGDIYLVLTVTGPGELMEEMKALRGQLKLSFDHTEGGR